MSDPFVGRCLTSSPVLRFRFPLIEPDVRICRIRLSDWLSRQSTRTARRGQRTQALDAQFSEHLRARELLGASRGHPAALSFFALTYRLIWSRRIRSGVTRLIANLPRSLVPSQAHQKRGPFPPPGLAASAVLRASPTPEPAAIHRGRPGRDPGRFGPPTFLREPSVRAVPTTTVDRAGLGRLKRPGASQPSPTVRRVGVHSLYFRGLLRIHTRYGPHGGDHAFHVTWPQGFATARCPAAVLGWLPR